MSDEYLDDMYINIALLEKDITEVYLYDGNMEFLASMGNRGDQSYERYQEAYESMTFSSMFQEEGSGLSRYVLYFPVYDLDSSFYGERKGMCVFVMRTDRFADMLENASAADGGQIRILDDKGQVVAAQGPASGTGDYYVQSAELRMEGWSVEGRLPKSAFSVLGGERFAAVTGAYLLAAAVLAGFIYYCIRRLVRPVREIGAFVSGLSRKPESRMRTRREDEIGAVIQSLNRMLDDRERLTREKMEGMQKMHETEMEKKQFQILAYRSQINPHFLYNTLECIHSMALYHDADDIGEIVIALSKLFRYSVKGGSTALVSEEISYIREYARIIRYRFMDKIKVEIRADKETENKKMIKLLLQPLVENAVLHGLERTTRGGTVWVKVRSAPGQKLELSVEDDGCGISPDQLEKIKQTLGQGGQAKGIGLSNIYQRLRLYYGDDIVFQIESEPGAGTRIGIRIPDQIEGGEETDV